MVDSLLHITYLHMTSQLGLLPDSCSQSSIAVAVEVRQSTVSCNTAIGLTQHLPLWDTSRRAGNDRIIKSYQVCLCRYEMHRSTVVVIHVIVCRRRITRSNEVDIAVNHRFTSWRATFRCRQMCWLLVESSSELTELNTIRHEGLSHTDRMYVYSPLISGRLTSPAHSASHLVSAIWSQWTKVNV